MWWLALTAVSIASDRDLGWLDPHASASVSATAGAIGLVVPGVGATVDAQAGLLGLPEVRAAITPTAIWTDRPRVLVPIEADVFWGLPSGTRLHLGPEAGLWGVPSLDRESWPVAVHAGVAWANHEDDVVEGFVGLQAIAWSDAGLILPRVRVRWVRQDSPLTVMLDVSGPALTLSVGGFWGTP